MATYEEQNFITKTRNTFVLSAETAIKEIKNKFAIFHSQLHQGERNLIYTIEKIQADILQKYDEITPKLKEIQRCRDSVISILTNNSNKQLLDTQLRTFTTEIDEVIGKSDIDKLINLKWRCSDLQVGTICQVTAGTISKSKPSPCSDSIFLNTISLFRGLSSSELGKKRSETKTDALPKKLRREDF